MRRGAEILVRTCANVEAGEEVVIVTDPAGRLARAVPTPTEAGAALGSAPWIDQIAGGRDQAVSRQLRPPNVVLPVTLARATAPARGERTGRNARSP